MKRRISKRRIKIVLKMAAAQCDSVFRFEQNDALRERIRARYVETAAEVYERITYLRPRETVKTVHSTI